MEERLKLIDLVILNPKHFLLIVEGEKETIVEFYQRFKDGAFSKLLNIAITGKLKEGGNGGIVFHKYRGDGNLLENDFVIAKQFFDEFNSTEPLGTSRENMKKSLKSVFNFEKE